MTGHRDHSPGYPLLKRSLLFVIGLAYTFPLFSQQHVPVITAVLPYTGPVGSVVTIKGANFDSVASRDTVFFGGIRARVSGGTVNSLTVAVPAGAVYGPISVTAGRLTAWSKPFIPVYTGGGTIDSSSFGSRTSLAVGIHPNSLATADFDGDGRSDLAGVLVDANEVAVLRNGSQSGNIRFMAADTFAAGLAPRAIVTADLNGDGKPDIVVANVNDNSVAVYQNASAPGAISFQPKMDIGTGSHPVYVAAADMDGDGMIDLVTADSSADSVSLFLNTTSVTGPISFAARVGLSAGSGPSWIVLGDLDGDGRPDMVVCDAVSNKFLIYRNTSVPGAISFSPAASFPTGASPLCAAIADLDGDGLPEVIICRSGSSGLAVFRNMSAAGTISLDVPVTIGAGGSATGISISDVNGDGKPDITIADALSNSALVLQNASVGGKITVMPPVMFNAGPAPTSIVAGDFDGDGKPDMALASYSGSPPDSVAVLRNLTGLLRYPSIDSFVPSSGRKGDTVVLHGHFFSTASAVSFGGVAAASYQVLSDSLIAAVVDSGGSGLVGVTTAWGSTNRGGFRFIYDTVAVSLPDSLSSGDTAAARGFRLLGFTGAVNGGQVQLQWSVADDSAIAYYVVQYSSDSVVFDAIGSVRAKRLDTAAYLFGDPAHSTGVAYYRLKIEDSVSQVSYSPVLAVRSDAVQQLIMVFPNPANDEVTAIVPATLNNSGFELVDMTGKIVGVVPVKAGATRVSIDVRRLSRGVYKLMWTDGVSNAFVTLLVMRK